MSAWSAERVREASAVRPSPRQLAWQRLEFYGFLHFGMNTFTDREWGRGHEDPALFDPERLDTDQWVTALAASGMRAVILTAKHHDGFCLWPSAFTRHSVIASPWRDGADDVVADVAASCARAGMRFGVYLSPWDRTAPTYGSGADYDDIFVGQLTELCTRYGPLFSVWFDGACGEGPNGAVQRYDWDRYVATVRSLQPDAVVSICGPDVRWCGNEAGHTRENEWSVVPASLRDAERTAALSQQSDDPAFARTVRSDLEDLGSRDAILASDEPLVWYPAEVNTSIRPGWFHHPAEDDAVRDADELFDIWRRSVGGNSTFLLNVPPTREGRVHAADVAALEALGNRIRSFFARDIAFRAAVPLPSRADGSSGPWVPDPGEARPSLVLEWTEPQSLEALVLEEDISAGQQLEHVVVDGILADGKALDAIPVGAVGYRRIVALPDAPLKELRITVAASRGAIRVGAVRVIGREPCDAGD